MKFDDILEHHVGEFGPYQKYIYVLSCLPFVYMAAGTMLPVFILVTPQHRCQVPGLQNDTYYAQSVEHSLLINATIPWKKGGREMSSCQIYTGADSEKGPADSNIQLNRTDIVAETKECSDWLFDDSAFISLATDFQMVCRYSILKSHFLMILFFGCVSGAFINGILSDLYGRKRVFLSCLVITMVTTGVQLISPWYWLLLASRFFFGFASSGVFSVMFVYMMEMVGPNYRMFAGILCEVFWCAGLFILAGAAYWIRHWKYLTIATAAPSVLFLLYIWILPESPRWLISAGKQDQADMVLRKIACYNKREMPQERELLGKVAELETREAKTHKASVESGQVWKLFTHKVLLVRLGILAINRFSIDLAYFGISLNVEHLTGNLFLNFTLSSTMWSVALVMVGKFCISAAFAVILAYNAEVFPTSVRASAMAILYIVGTVGGSVSPYIVEMCATFEDERLSAALPMLVYGGLSLVSGMLSLLLPETKDTIMPESIRDAIKFERIIKT